jgi:cytochrome c oxidase subunit 4
MIVSVRTYCWVAVVLLVLLAATVALSLAPLGPLRLAVALGIAGVKAGLVALFFMHVRYGFPLMRLFSVAGLLWLAILIGLTLSDYATRPHWPPPTHWQLYEVPGK